MIHRKYESWIRVERRGEKLGEHFVRRHWTRRGAERYGQQLIHDPQVLARQLESLLWPGAVGPDGISHMLWLEPEIRQRKEKV